MQHRPERPSSLEELLADEVDRLREEAEQIAPGARREAILRKARQTEIALEMSERLRSPGLRALPQRFLRSGAETFQEIRVALDGQSRLEAIRPTGSVWCRGRPS